MIGMSKSFVISKLLCINDLLLLILFNNFEIFKLLLKNNADPYIITNDGSNVYITCLMYNRPIILDYLLNNRKFIDFTTYNGENILQVATNYQITNNLIDLKINLNNVTNDFGLAIIHQSIILNNFELFKKLLEKDNPQSNDADNIILLQNRLKAARNVGFNRSPNENNEAGYVFEHALSRIFGLPEQKGGYRMDFAPTNRRLNDNLVKGKIGMDDQTVYGDASSGRPHDIGIFAGKIIATTGTKGQKGKTE
jgi:ankyrin repeat protein